jgi:hypothetical protein
LIQQLTPEVVRIFWYSKQFEGKTSEKEPWYGTDYIIERIDKKLLEDWTTAFIDGNLCLPSQNLFIPTDFSIRDPAPKVITALPALFASLTIQGTYIWSFFIGSIVSKYLLYPMQEQASEVGLYEVCCFNLHRSNTHSY